MLVIRLMNKMEYEQLITEVKKKKAAKLEALECETFATDGGWGSGPMKSLDEKRKSGWFSVSDCSIFGTGIAFKDWP